MSEFIESTTKGRLNRGTNVVLRELNDGNEALFGAMFSTENSLTDSLVLNRTFL